MTETQTMTSENAKRRILVVDDEPSIRRLLTENLSREGFECEDCPSGDEALKALGERGFDAVISDYCMPGISVVEVLRYARKTYPYIAFLIATGMDDVRVGIQAMKEGADDYILKPLRSDAVLASVNRALSNRHLEREVAGYRVHLEEMVNQRTRQLQAAMKRIEQTYDDTLEALAAALDLRDNETAGHSRRVMRFSIELAKRVGCTHDQMTNIARGSYLHDIGKIGIPDAIMLKPAKLTADERQIMETHVRIGYDLVCRIAFLANAAEIVLTHHERFDGTGYPQGLIGNEIPIGARIFAIADTLDAMTSDRPYRRALPYSTARAEIIREAGQQFDPAMVEAFLSIPEQSLEAIRLDRRAAEPARKVQMPARTTCGAA